MAWFSYHGGHSGQFCAHAEDSLEAVVIAAVEAGFSHYGLSEHCPRYHEERLFPEEVDAGVEGLHARFEEYVVEARWLKEVYADRLEILVGFETEKLPDESWPGVMAELRDRHGFDYMVGSVHHLGKYWVDGGAEETGKLADECGGVEAMQARYFDSLGELVETLRPEVVGHLDLIRKFAGMEARFSADVMPNIERTLEAVRSVDARLDVNCGAYREALSPVYPLPDILRQAQRMGIGVTLGDDSHGVSTLGEGLDASMRSIAAAGYREVDYLTQRGGEVHWASAPIHEVKPAGQGR